MIKCPQCLKLRPEGNDVCPHCGEELYGIRSRPSQRVASERAAGAGAGHRKREFGGAEIDLGDASTPGLELAEDPSPARALPPAAAEPLPAPTAAAARRPVSPAERPAHADDIDAMEAIRLGAFGAPEPGPLGAIRYFWRVSRRRAELRVQLSEASFALEARRDERTALLAGIGRAAAAARTPGGSHDSLVERALAADARRGDAERRSAEEEREHATRAEDLATRIGALEAELGPLVEEEARILAELERARADAKRAELASKRAEIERRNVVELIAKRQEAFADPTCSAEERRRLLAEISELDARSPALNAGADSARDAFERIREPLAAVEARHGATAAAISERRGSLRGLGAELESAKRRMSEARERAGSRLDAERRSADAAFAAVGEGLLVGLDRSAGPLGGAAREVDDASAQIAAMERRSALLEAAASSYDRAPYARGRLAVLGLALLCAAAVVVTAIAALP